ncbi:MAG: GNAT family N-acetyltransferase, partial [Proteobacteria bacterium]|nr:GNAT family N-acetyltransferase [Pseudomonadota bacterium]
CIASPKYAKGRWFVLEHEGELKSSLICYRDAFSLPSNAVGIGSVATTPAHRRQGFAATLIREVMSRFSEDDTIDAFFLYSDVDPAIYEKLGFVKLSTEQQRYKSSTAMVRPLNGSLHSFIGRDFKAPDYF